MWKYNVFYLSNKQLQIWLFVGERCLEPLPCGSQGTNKCTWFGSAGGGAAWEVFLQCCPPGSWIPEQRWASLLGLLRSCNADASHYTQCTNHVYYRTVTRHRALVLHKALMWSPLWGHRINSNGKTPYRSHPSGNLESSSCQSNHVCVWCGCILSLKRSVGPSCFSKVNKRYGFNPIKFKFQCITVDEKQNFLSFRTSHSWWASVVHTYSLSTRVEPEVKIDIGCLASITKENYIKKLKFAKMLYEIH